MKQQFQTPGLGDCHRTCLAMILDVDRDQVPHFMANVPPGCAVEDPRSIAAEQAERDWIGQQFQLGLVYVPMDGSLSMAAIVEQLGRFARDTPVILGCSVSSGINHSVVVLNGDIYDPSGWNSSRDYHPNTQGFWWLTILAPSSKWNTLPALR